ncbi:MAG: VanZ family protein [bacterium]|nr:VanZ family protein [bacterium]
MSTRQFLALIPVVVLSIAIFVASSLPALSPPSLGIEWQDKVFHAIAYFVYGLCVQVAVLGYKPSISMSHAWIYVVLIGVLFGISDEVHQAYVPSRMAEVADAVADAIGVLLSTTLLGATRRFLFRLGWR